MRIHQDIATCLQVVIVVNKNVYKYTIMNTTFERLPNLKV